MPSSKRTERCTTPEHQRCEALLYDSWLMPTNDRCRSHALYVVDGKRCCSKHGAMMALEAMLRDKTAKYIMLSRPSLRVKPRFINGHD